MKKKTPEEWFQHYKNLDYSRMPLDVWEDHLQSVTTILDDVEISLQVISKSIERLSK